jgi:hypothetical protein
VTLEKVTIGVRTFLRDHKLFNTLGAIRDTMPEVKITVADCGEHNEEKDGIYADLIRSGHKVIWLDYDAGFGRMSNALAQSLDTPYLFMASDDFDFRPPTARKGLEKLTDVLDHTDVDIVGGRVRGPYEFTLEDRGDTIIEHPVCISGYEDLWFVDCDLTINCSLIRADVLKVVHWDDDVKIGGGEHGAWFIDAKRACFRVAVVPTVQISEQKGEDSERYNQYRRRASSKARPCFDKRGIRKYVLGTGQVDYERIEYKEPITR